MGRITRQELKPEIAREYAIASFDNFGPDFIIGLVRDFPNAKRILDFGCGDGQIDITLATYRPLNLEIHALDSSPKMIEIAKGAIEIYLKEKQKDLPNKLFFYNSKMENFPIDGNKYDAIISKDFIHFLKDPTKLWRLIQKSAKDETVLYHMDWIRPETEKKAKEIVSEILGEFASYDLKEDLLSSLKSALTPEEIKAQLYDYFPFSRNSLEVNVVDQGRHMLIKGIYHKSPFNNPQYRASHTRSKKH